MKYLTIAATALALSAGAASAATITETTDFTNNGFPSQNIGVLSTTEATIVQGSIAFSCTGDEFIPDCENGDFLDNFDLGLPTGFELDSFSVAISNFLTTGNVAPQPFADPNVPIGLAFAGGSGQDLVAFSDNGTFSFDDPFNFAGGFSVIDMQVGVTFLSGLGTVEFDYEITYNLAETVAPSPVPLPAGFPLLAAGLIGMGVLARRKKPA